MNINTSDNADRVKLFALLVSKMSVLTAETLRTKCPNDFKDDSRWWGTIFSVAIFYLMVTNRMFEQMLGEKVDYYIPLFNENFSPKMQELLISSLFPNSNDEQKRILKGFFGTHIPLHVGEYSGLPLNWDSDEPDMIKGFCALLRRELKLPDTSCLVSQLYLMLNPIPGSLLIQLSDQCRYLVDDLTR